MPPKKANAGGKAKGGPKEEAPGKDKPAKGNTIKVDQGLAPGSIK